MRNYAIYLGLDLNEVQALYDAEHKESRLVPGIFRPKDIELTPPRRPLVRASVVLGLVLVLVMLVVGGWAFWRYGLPAVQPLLRLLTPAAEQTAQVAQTADAQETAIVGAATATRAAALAAATETPTEPVPTPTAVEAEPTATVAPTDTPAPTATPDRSAQSPTSTAAPTRTPTATRTPRPSPTAAEGVTLSIRVIERAWLQVTVDGQELPGELLEVGAERTWEADQTIFFICGNAGGVEVTVNGEELGTLGGRAEVVDRTWTPSGEATPTPVPF